MRREERREDLTLPVTSNMPEHVEPVRRHLCDHGGRSSVVERVVKNVVDDGSIPSPVIRVVLAFISVVSMIDSAQI